MVKKIKNWLKSKFPPSKTEFENQISLLNESFSQRISQIMIAIETNSKILDIQSTILSNNKELIENINKLAQSIKENTDSSLINEHINAETFANFSDDLQNSYIKINNLIEQFSAIQIKNSRLINEVLWGEIFENTISGSFWLREQSFSPGRWAVGYSYLYVVYRILNELGPKNILELGLGQSTKMISQYVDSQFSVKHLVIEHDENWIEFFKKNFKVSERTKIVQLDLIQIQDSRYGMVDCYKGFENLIENQKFDFISIDAPPGGKNLYSRVDILSLLPECLMDSFIIAIDDSQRKGEKNLINEIISSLSNADIPYAIGKYSGTKDTTFIVSENYHFVCTM